MVLVGWLDLNVSQMVLIVHTLLVSFVCLVCLIMHSVIAFDSRKKTQLRKSFMTLRQNLQKGWLSLFVSYCFVKHLCMNLIDF